MINVAIRADGNPEIGMGHLMRCMALGLEFKKQNGNVTFLSRGNAGIALLKSKGFEVIELQKGVEEKGLEKEADEVACIIKNEKTQVLVVDSYNVNNEYFMKLKENIKVLIYIDDLNKFIYPVDILINGNITGEYFNYKKHGKDELLLLGPRYNLIRCEFENIAKRRINKEVKNLMVTTGGSDPDNMSIKLLEMITQNIDSNRLTINVIVGNMFKNKAELRKIADANRNIILHENTNCMAEIMLKSDLAISSGGSTLYELCACGTPTLAFIYADNQVDIVDKMQELGYIESLGWYDKLNPCSFLESFSCICNDYERRKKNSLLMQKLVDAKGAKRAVQEIKKFCLRYDIS